MKVILNKFKQLGPPPGDATMVIGYFADGSDDSSYGKYIWGNGILTDTNKVELFKIAQDLCEQVQALLLSEKDITLSNIKLFIGDFINDVEYIQEPVVDIGVVDCAPLSETEESCSESHEAQPKETK